MFTKYTYIFLIMYSLKVIHDLYMWIYGYYLRFKWVKYFRTNNINLISYTYQIEKYLFSVPHLCLVNDLFADCYKEEVLKLFIQSHGYFKHKFVQNFNIFYWIELIIYLPQNLLLYLNPRFKKRTLHFFNFLYWVFSIIFTIYNDEIIPYIKDLIKLVFKYFSKN